MRGEKGSHVGFILSFVIFITFIVFAYSILQPAVQTNRDKQFLADYAKGALVKAASGNYSVYAIVYNKTSNTCVYFTNWETKSLITGTGLIVKNVDREVLLSNFSSQDLIIRKANPLENFSLVYDSEEFENLSQISRPAGCQEMGNNNYSVTQITQQDYIFERKILNLTAYYQTNYSELKKMMNIPIGNEFDFNFRNVSNGIIYAGNATPKSTDVYAEEVPIEYVDSQASIKTGFIIIRVW